MLTYIRIILIVYLLAVNVYAFLLVKTNRDAAEEDENFVVKEGKYFLTGLLGGALGIYVSMFVFRFKTENLFLMSLMPVLIAISAFIVYECFAKNFFLYPLNDRNVNDSRYAFVVLKTLFR